MCAAFPSTTSGKSSTRYMNDTYRFDVSSKGLIPDEGSQLRSQALLRINYSKWPMGISYSKWPTYKNELYNRAGVLISVIEPLEK
jgi:hypothetical protein